jgi:hypothetical protein
MQSSQTPIAHLESYTRQNQPDNFSDRLVYYRMVERILYWMDTRKIREPRVFLEQEGKEYAALIQYLEDTLGQENIRLEADLFQLAWAARQP